MKKSDNLQIILYFTILLAHEKEESPTTNHTKEIITFLLPLNILLHQNVRL